MIFRKLNIKVFNIFIIQIKYIHVSIFILSRHENHYSLFRRTHFEMH